jgi:hypothetical protein
MGKMNPLSPKELRVRGKLIDHAARIQSLDPEGRKISPKELEALAKKFEISVDEAKRLLQADV